MARTAAIELAQTPGGAGVVAALLPRLWQAGGHHALEAAQIAWECRDVPAIRESVLAFLTEMCDSDDFAVRHTAVSLARRWGPVPTTKSGGLPAIYRLELPPNPQVDRFEPPSGTSSTSSGLYTDDVYAWTWPLEDALRSTVTATGLGLANLRARAAQLMNRMGGTAAFGPDATARQQQRLQHLSLHCAHRRLLVSAALQAVRELIGELVAAEAIDPRLIPFILHHAAAFSSCISTVPPEPRPHGVPSSEMPDMHRSTDSTEWRANAEQNAVMPTMTGHVVLAATALHQRRHFRGEWSVEQYSGPDTGEAEDDLPRQLLRLPQIIVADGIYPGYDGIAPAAVVHPDPGISGSVDPYMVTLCPRVAARLGWRSDPRHVLTYLDTQDDVVARTLAWRDGGVRCQEADTAVSRYGYILVVREDRADDIRPYLATTQVSRAWRLTQNAGEARLVNCGSRVEAAPGFAQSN